MILLKECILLYEIDNLFNFVKKKFLFLDYEGDDWI